MKKFKNDVGLTYYEISLQECITIGGFGICDYCNEMDNALYLIPVLNSVYCKNCFERWSKKAKHYAEDDVVENKLIKHYESLLEVEGVL